MKIALKRIIQIVTGLLFLSSGVLKAIDSESFAILIGSYGLGWAGILSPVISGIEIVLGLCLILDIQSKKTAYAVVVLTILFTIAFTYAFLFKGVKDCGCMGTLIDVPPLISFTRNFLIIIGGLWIINFASEGSGVPIWKKWIVYVIGSISFCIAGYTLGAHMLDKNKLSKGDAINTNILRFYNDKISSGKSIVFIFSPNCNHCWNSTENVKSIKNIPEFNNVIGITFPGEDETQYLQQMKPNFDVYKYPTNELSDVVNEIPVLLVLENGKIKRIFNSHDIPCGQLLKIMEDTGMK